MQKIMVEQVSPHLHGFEDGSLLEIRDPETHFKALGAQMLFSRALTSSMARCLKWCYNGSTESQME